jgi:hypothetical protein
MKLSKTLTRRTKLNPDQLARVQQQEGNGEASKYDANGQYSLELGRRLNKARKKAPKYILYSDQLGRRVYVADRRYTMEEKPLTFTQSEALTFLFGFDEEQVKIDYYSQYLNLRLLTKRL